MAKHLVLDALALERLTSILALAYRSKHSAFEGDNETRLLHSQVVSLADDNAEYLTPNYPVPAIVACQWCGSREEVCDYNGDGYWCPSLCFALN